MTRLSADWRGVFFIQTPTATLEHPTIRLGYSVFQVSAADNAEEMRKRIAEEAPDAVILDIKMPGEDGLSALPRLRADGDIPVIMLTATADVVDRILGLEKATIRLIHLWDSHLGVFLIQAEGRRGGRHGWENRIRLIYAAACLELLRRERLRRRRVGASRFQHRRRSAGSRSGGGSVVTRPWRWAAIGGPNRSRPAPPTSSTGSQNSLV